MSNLLIKYAKKETEIPRFLKQSKLFSYNFIEKRQIKFQASFVDKDELVEKDSKIRSATGQNHSTSCMFCQTINQIDLMIEKFSMVILK